MIAILDPSDNCSFPDPEEAQTDPNGLLAIGGDLSAQRLCNAFRRGIFPWFGPDDPILWWAPDPRAVLFPEKVHISRNLGKCLRRGQFSVTFDRDFRGVLQGCAAPRRGDSETWLVPAMIAAYLRLHRLGIAHSVEVWQDNNLVGGLYGVAIGRVFFGESMFSRTDNASKVALATLCRRLLEWDFALIDCQICSEHLARMGSVEIRRSEFVALLERHCEHPAKAESWTIT